MFVYQEQISCSENILTQARTQRRALARKRIFVVNSIGDTKQFIHNQQLKRVKERL